MLTANALVDRDDLVQFRWRIEKGTRLTGSRGVLRWLPLLLAVRLTSWLVGPSAGRRGHLVIAIPR